jgi:hypothetical protein
LPGSIGFGDLSALAVITILRDFALRVLNTRELTGRREILDGGVAKPVNDDLPVGIQ